MRPQKVGITEQIGRIVQLARYHRVSQIGWRLWRRIQNGLEQRGIYRLRFPVDQLSLRDDRQPLLRSMAARRRAAYPHRQAAEVRAWLATGRFRFLNEVHALATSQDEGPVAWNWRIREAPRLWRFHFQCHEFLLALSAEKDRVCLSEFLEGWLQAKGQGDIGQPNVQELSFTPEVRTASGVMNADAWHPFCISRRLPVWLMLAAQGTIPASLQTRFWNSVTQQLFWLINHLEYDLGGNHLLENYRALVLAKECLVGSNAIRHQRIMLGLEKRTIDEINQQVTSWGEHFELAPTYHGIMTLAVREIAGALNMSAEASSLDLAQRATEQADAMSSFLQGLCHPDEQIPLFGDSALDETPLPSALQENSIPKQSSVADLFDESDKHELIVSNQGPYWTWRSPSDDYLVFDTGHIACDHLPAHGHADLLGIEASLRGQRLIVDAGTFDYEDSSMRHYCRESLAHNVATVDGLNHADVWSRFRMGRRGKPLFRSSGRKGNWNYMWSAHDAYKHLGVMETHRLLLAMAGPLWICIDWIRAASAHRLTSRVRLNLQELRNPLSIKQDITGLSSVEFQWPLERTDRLTEEGDWRISQLGPGCIRIEDGWYCPEFGHRHAIPVLSFEGPSPDRGEANWVGWALSARDEKIRVRVNFGNNEHEISIVHGTGETSFIFSRPPDVPF
jgi:hypothetical protein